MHAAQGGLACSWCAHQHAARPEGERRDFAQCVCAFVFTRFYTMLLRAYAGSARLMIAACKSSMLACTHMHVCMLLNLPGPTLSGPFPDHHLQTCMPRKNARIATGALASSTCRSEHEARHRRGWPRASAADCSCTGIMVAHAACARGLARQGVGGGSRVPAIASLAATPAAAAAGCQAGAATAGGAASDEGSGAW